MAAGEAMQKKRVPVGELQFGMYVASSIAHDRHPFMFQGFVLRTPQQLEALKKYCATVLVDTERSEMPAGPRPARRSTRRRRAWSRKPGAARVAYGDSRKLIRDVLSTVKLGRQRSTPNASRSRSPP